MQRKDLDWFLYDTHKGMNSYIYINLMYDHPQTDYTYKVELNCLILTFIMLISLYHVNKITDYPPLV